MILVIDTANNKNVYLGLWENKWLEMNEWSAEHNLMADIMEKITDTYKKVDKSFQDTTGVIINIGPGSFTGLRIGISIANAMAYSLNIPIAGLNDTENKTKLLEGGLQKLGSKKTFDGGVFPEYGREPNITQPKKL